MIGRWNKFVQIRQNQTAIYTKNRKNEIRYVIDIYLCFLTLVSFQVTKISN